MSDVPVAIFVHRRPALTRRVLDAVREAKPRTLLVVADGPSDAAQALECREVRSLFDGIDWDCRLLTNFADTRLGCAARVSSGLDWVFGQVDRAVVLEDDTVPDASFFTFCDQLLARYERDDRVMQISGTNIAGETASPCSYTFSRFVLPPWGWASWARAWERYDFSLRDWERHKPTVRARLGTNFGMWEELVDGYRRTFRSWDLQWNVALWCHGGVTAVPSRNLVSNIGYGRDATFTRFDQSLFREMKTASCPNVLTHPPDLDESSDDWIEPAVIAFIREIMKPPRPPREDA